MSMRTELRDMLAAAALEQCKEAGVQATYTSLTGESTVTNLWAMPEKVTSNEGEVIGVDVDVSRKRFMVPRQSSPTWPPTNGVFTKAKLVSESVTWYVDAIEEDELAATWMLDCIRDHPALVGVL